MIIGPVGAKFFHADGRTDITKLIVFFFNFAKAPKIFAVVSTCPNIQRVQPFVIRIIVVYYQRPEFNRYIHKYVHETQEINEV
jgi:hypothetical protein